MTRAGKTYVLVTDYKSGNAALTLPEVYHGLKLQLLTYLLVSLQHLAGIAGAEHCLPAGALYYFLRNPLITAKGLLTAEEAQREINKQLKMPGWLLADTGLVRLLDSGINGYSEFLKVAISEKTDTFHSNSLGGLKTEAEFAALLQHTRHILTQIANGILAGEVSISPYSLRRVTPCGYCVYRPVCQFDRIQPENTHRLLAVEKDRFYWNGSKRQRGRQAMEWSKEQWQAITAKGQNLLVAAAAGSGKTTLLVERIIRRIIDERIDVDRLLVVTFTNAAAGEMRSRIREAIEEQLKEASADLALSRHLERQQMLLNSAAISTLHSFCQSIVRQYFYLLDIEPGFRIAATAETSLIQADIIEKLFQDKYEQVRPRFSRLLNTMALMPVMTPYIN